VRSAITSSPASPVGRNATEPEALSIEHTAERVKLDLWYINNWSLWLDLLILIKTIFEVLRRRNAY
jgi:undecaprenyl-phosphate galactose phosphotransferase/putative colanic acid biosynthesis UDP-glucose lipid carrier transferase